MEHRLWTLGTSLLLIATMAGCGSKAKTEQTTDDEVAASSSDQAADPLASTDPLPGSDASLSSPTAGSTSASAKWSGSTPMPKVASAPFDSGGVWMNAYQFVRSKDDQWQTLSTRAYGSPGQAETLKAWNPGVKLKPGNIVYYNSPQRPTDQERMRHIADDLGLPLENVSVNAGDTLSKMAEKFYQEPQLWKEIAALNPSISRPDWVIPGTALRVMPSTGDSSQVTGALGSLGKVDPLESTPTPPEKPMNRPTASLTQPASNPVTISPPAEVASGEESLLQKLMRIARENMLIVAGVGLGLVGLAGTAAVRARVRAE
jgi:nucleoid-associated protein YgaU